MSRQHTSPARRLMVIARDALGYVALVENAHLGLLYRSNSAPLPIGHGMKAYVETVRSDGKIDPADGRYQRMER